MTFQQFLPLFLQLLLVGAMCITGWFVITRGRLVPMPDGSVVKKGKLFKSFYFFMTRKKKQKRTVFIEGMHLYKLLFEIRPELLKAAVRGVAEPRIVMHENIYIKFENVIDVRQDLMRFFARKYNLSFDGKAGYDCYRVSREEEEYVFPEWVRLPLAECATCFSSVYGTAYYWCVIPFVSHPFSWSTIPLFHYLFFWITFCFSLAVLNTVLAKNV